MKRLSVGLTICSLFLTACAEEQPSFSLLPASDTFYQNTSNLNNKIDILFVIDNSGSMADEQNNLASNFSAFISDFTNHGYDFKIAVAATDAWRGLFASPNYAKFRDGSDATGHSGVFVINPLTANINSVFATNVRLGTTGAGDERAFQSFKTALNSNLNTGFVRQGAYLAVIIVSDEDDFSHDGSFSINRNYNYAGLHTIGSYITYLDGITQSTGATRRYSVSAITVDTEACRQQTAASGGIIGTRYMQLADQTDGVVGSICSPNFSDTLNDIQVRIAELSTQFFLSREPRPETIVVQVNGVSISENAVNGWTYDPDAVSIVFHGSAIPPQGSQIHIDFEPVTIL